MEMCTYKQSWYSSSSIEKSEQNVEWSELCGASIADNGRVKNKRAGIVEIFVIKK